MPLDTTTKVVNTILGWITYALVGYLIYLSVTGGAETPVEMWAAALLAVIGYTLHHGKDAIIVAIRAWKGNGHYRPYLSESESDSSDEDDGDGGG